MIVPRVNVSSLSPMHPTLVREPFHRDGWVYEEKVDGYRMVVPLSGACSLLLAARIGRRFAYVGRCEWGVSRRIVAELRERIAVRATPACSGIEGGRGVVWVQPRAVAEVQDNEMMQGRLRDPVLRHILLSPA